MGIKYPIDIAGVFHQNILFDAYQMEVRHYIYFIYLVIYHSWKYVIIE